MYAIRSYYAGALHGTAALPKRWLKKLDPATRAACTEQALALIGYAPALSGAKRAVRITSYNVCYTKLLRNTTPTL